VDWTVPTVAHSSSKLDSASWVGVDGLNNKDLIQTGTAQDTSDGYWAWVEILPAPATPINGPVKPGDRVNAYVQEDSPGSWTIYLQDSTQGWYYKKSFSYSGPGDSAEWIEEAPTVNGKVSALANFHTAHFSGTSVYGDFSQGLGWYSTNLTAGNEIAMINAQHTRVLAWPSALTAPSKNGQSFTVTYVLAPSAPTSLKAVGGVKSAKLTWKPPQSNGGTPITGYYVRIYKSGKLQRTVTVTSTSASISKLTAGAAYRFSVAAHSEGNYTSAYTAQSPTVRPKN
jgi:hypothetical protein